jgi:hypothetical protein
MRSRPCTPKRKARALLAPSSPAQAVAAPDLARQRVLSIGGKYALSEQNNVGWENCTARNSTIAC